MAFKIHYLFQLQKKAPKNTFLQPNITNGVCLKEEKILFFSQSTWFKLHFLHIKFCLVFRFFFDKRLGNDTKSQKNMKKKPIITRFLLVENDASTPCRYTKRNTKIHLALLKAQKNLSSAVSSLRSQTKLVSDETITGKVMLRQLQTKTLPSIRLDTNNSSELSPGSRFLGEFL